LSEGGFSSASSPLSFTARGWSGILLTLTFAQPVLPRKPKKVFFLEEPLEFIGDTPFFPDLLETHHNLKRNAFSRFLLPLSWPETAPLLKSIKDTLKAL